MKDFVCKKCGNTTYVMQEKLNGTGKALGLYCAKCGTWHKWLNKQEKVVYATVDSDKDKEIARLTAENAELRETLSKMEKVEKELRARLEKAVELPCKVGDIVYYLQTYCDYKGETVKHCSKSERPIMCECDEIAHRWSSKYWIYVIREKPFELRDLTRIGKTLFLSREEAEAKIVEFRRRYRDR